MDRFFFSRPCSGPLYRPAGLELQMLGFLLRQFLVLARFFFVPNGPGRLSGFPSIFLQVLFRYLRLSAGLQFLALVRGAFRFQCAPDSFGASLGPGFNGQMASSAGLAKILPKRGDIGRRPRPRLLRGLCGLDIGAVGRRPNGGGVGAFRDCSVMGFLLVQGSRFFHWGFWRFGRNPILI